MLVLFFTTDAGAAAAVGRKETDDIAMDFIMYMYCACVSMRARVKKREERERFFYKNPKRISHTSNNITEERARPSQESTRERRSDVYFSLHLCVRARAPRHSFLRE